MDTPVAWNVKMVPLRRADKTTHIADIAVKIEAALCELHHYYKSGRHLRAFPQKPYFLFSHCAHLLFSLWLVEQDHHTGIFAESPGLAALLDKSDFDTLRYADYSRRMLYANAYQEHLKSEPKWFKFWMKLLQGLQASDAAGIETFYGKFSACLEGGSLLDEKLSRRDQDVLEDLVQGPRAGRLLLHSIWVLEDLLFAASSHVARLDPAARAIEQMELLICLLSQLRRIIVWEAAVEGPYTLLAGGDWDARSTLTRVLRGSTAGLLAITLKEDGGQVTCVFTRESDGKANTRTWVRRLAALPCGYEETLFKTWPHSAQEQPADADARAQAQARWIIRALEAGQLEATAKHVDKVLEGLGRCPAYHAFVENVARTVRNDQNEWTAVQLAWSYIRTLDQLASKLRFACREAKALGGENPAESVITNLWPPQQAPIQETDTLDPETPVRQGAEADTTDMLDSETSVRQVAEADTADTLDSETSVPPGAEADTADTMAPGTSVSQGAETDTPDTLDSETSVPQVAGADTPDAMDSETSVPEEAETDTPDALDHEPSVPQEAETDTADTLDPEPSVPQEAAEGTSAIPASEASAASLAQACEETAVPPIPVVETRIEPARCQVNDPKQEERQVPVHHRPCPAIPKLPAPTGEQTPMESLWQPECPELEGGTTASDAASQESPEKREVDRLTGMIHVLISETTRPHGSESGPSTGGNHGAPRRSGACAAESGPAPGVAALPAAEVLVRKLLQWHLALTDGRCVEPISSRQLQQDLEWSQSKVQHTMGRVFGNKPFQVYKSKCMDGSIRSFLEDSIRSTRTAGSSVKSPVAANEGRSPQSGARTQTLCLNTGCAFDG